MLSAIRIGSVSIPVFLVMLVMGTAAMMILLYYRRDHFDLNGPTSVIFAFLLMLCGVAGTKILYILENFEETLQNGISLGGVSFFGAVFLVPVLMFPIGKAFNLKFGQTTDACAPCVLIMITLMRFSCFLTGCCGGWEAELFGFRFRWPTQMMESIGDCALMTYFLQKEAVGKLNTRLYPCFMLGYGVMRFCIEFLRDSEKNLLFLSRGQWFALISIAVGFVWQRAAHRRKV